MQQNEQINGLNFLAMLLKLHSVIAVSVSIS